MAETSGLVQKLKWAGSIAFVYVGPTPTTSDLFFVHFQPADSEVELASKGNLVYALTQAQMRGYVVSVIHPDDGAEVLGVNLGPLEISAIGDAVHEDFFTVSGSGIPADAQLVFESGPTSISVVPDVVRPHFVFVAQLPATIPVGRNLLKLQSASWVSAPVPVNVSAGPPYTIRALYSGAPKDRPYTIAFAGNGAIEAATGGTFQADPILTNRAGYHAAVSYCLQNLLLVTEDLLRAGDLDAQIRFVSIFDPGLVVDEGSSLAHEIDPNMMETRRPALAPFLLRYNEIADVVFVIHGSTTHTRATAWFTSDDSMQASTPFTYDGNNEVHGHFPATPGSVAIPVSVNTTGLTALHEFGHAASNFVNGKVVDLYVDGTAGGFQVNKKFRAAAGDPIPANFGTYNATTYQSDQNRDALGYPPSWRSYHPALIDPTRPNLMDNYWLAFDNPLFCRLDQLTYDFFRDRLAAKVSR